MDAYLESGTGTERFLRGHDLAFVPAAGSSTRTDSSDERRLLGQLYVASGEGNQTFVFDLLETVAGTLELQPLPRYLPMRLFGGKAIVGAGGQVWYDFADRWLPLVEQYRPRHEEQATLYTPIDPDARVFDGHQPDCTWHRLLVDACIPPGAEIDVESRAANDLSTLRLLAAGASAAPPIRWHRVAVRPTPGSV
jgi:hypothetical protein